LTLALQGEKNTMADLSLLKRVISPVRLDALNSIYRYHVPLDSLIEKGFKAADLYVDSLFLDRLFTVRGYFLRSETLVCLNRLRPDLGKLQ
jgi:hypothetical protein